MSDSTPVFKVGDKVVTKGGSEGVVVFAFPADKQNCSNYGLLVEFSNWAGCLTSERLSLVPDPMVARREAYIAWASLAWPNGPGGFKEHFDLARSGKMDGAVQQYYDAFVATKHLFV